MKIVESSSKWVENTVGKGEIARYEQFLLFPKCFQKTCTADKEKPGLVWERVKESGQALDSKHVSHAPKSNVQAIGLLWHANV